MQRLRTTFKRSRTPTGAEMKSQSSLEVPKQVRSASFDEIQLEAQRQESRANAELKSIANMAIATSGGSSNQPSSSSLQPPASSSSSSSAYSPGAGGSSRSPSKHFNTLRIPQLQTGQRSKSFDVAASTTAERAPPSMLDRSSSTAGSIMASSTNALSSYGYVSRWRNSSERENPPAAAYTCWHCACVDEYKASIGASDSWEDEFDDGDDGDDDDDDDDEDYAHDAGDEADYGSTELEPATPEGTVLQVERDHENSYYFVVLQRASEDADDDNSDCSRREGSPEIRVTLSVDEPAVASQEFVDNEALDAAQLQQHQGRQRRRSITRQEALTAFPSEGLLSVSFGSQDEVSVAAAAQAAAITQLQQQQHQKEQKQQQQQLISSDDDEEDLEEDKEKGDAGETGEEQQESHGDNVAREEVVECISSAAGLVVRDIFLTVPDLKRDRAASVDSCFNNNKNGKIETCYSLQVPQQSARSKSVDIVLPTEAQTRYTTLVPEESRTTASFTGEKDDGPSPGQREIRSTPDWSDAAVNGEHLWVPSAASGEFCYVNDCSKHGPRMKCSACRVVAHTACTASLGFKCKPSYRDIGVRQYREQKVTNHHWVHRRSQKGKCTNCGKSFQSKLSFSSKEIIAVDCSWCKWAYHNRESCFNAQKIGEQCELGLHGSIIVPPSWIVKVPKKCNFKSSLRKSPKSQKKTRSKANQGTQDGDKEDPCKLWAIKPIPNSNVSPVLVFINPRSGGNQGAKLLQKFQWLLNPRQVFDLTQGGPRMGLELFKRVQNLRILACGGDGTVGWVLSVLDQINADPPPAVGTLPLGTGNDLARALGWGGGYTDEPIGKILTSMAESEISILDRWKLDVERNTEASGNDEDAAKGKENLPLNVVNNYFSLGVDAHIALEFHEAREAHPERFNSRLRNKMFYGQMGGKDLVVRRWKDLSEFVTLECDGQDMTSKLKEHRVHAILFLNIDSYGGGTHPWGGGIGRPPTTEDGLIEVVGLTTYQLPLLQAGGHGTSIAQCSTAKLVTTKTIPMQVDGEACRLLPSKISMSLLNKATMLAKRRTTGKVRRTKTETEKLKLPLMRIKMGDYENYHNDKERLIKTATQWMADPLELEAAMDLESLRKMLAKDYPMDTCCFLDSCTAERFFRIDRAQEQFHYVADIVSEAIYILHENPLNPSSSQTDNPSREERRSKVSSADRRSNRDSHHSGGVSGGGSKSRNPSNRNSLGVQESRRSSNYDNYENHHHSGSKSSRHDHRQSKTMSTASGPLQPPSFISPEDRLFGLSSEVHTFSREPLGKTSQEIVRAAKNGDLVGLRQLHQRGMSLLSMDETGQTALHYASKQGHRDIVRYLIACAPPAILNMVDKEFGQTALHKAAQQKRRSICCMLVAGGAKLTLRDRSGNTPRDLALAAEDHELAAYLHSQEQFQLVTEDDNMS